jgi:hypothetical protein
MKRTILFIPLSVFLASLPAFAAAGEAQLIAFSGNVEVRTTREGQWVPAADKAEIAEGGAIRTGADGAAVVLMPNKSKIWIKESSDLEIEQRKTLTSRLALLFGQMKVRVPHLMRKEKFEVRTPAAVCAVRGTEFTVETADTGAMSINVLYGEVKLNFVIPPEKGGAELFIPQGRNMRLEEKGKPGKLAMMTAEQEKSSLENWNPGLSPAERQKDQKEKENDRAQLREFAKVTNGTENSVKTFLNTVRESDIETGRTLKDIHGNVVRVAQLLMRPHSDEIQFVNLVKRPSYNAINNNSVNGGFNYNGGAVGDRLDYAQVTVNFNQNLPQSIEAWPGFFSGNDVKPDWASFVMANKTKKDEIFFIAQLSKYDAVTDNLVNNSAAIGLAVNATNGGDRDVIVTGVIKNETGVLAVEGLDRISRQQVKYDSINSGKLVYTADGVTLVNGAASDVVWAMRLDADAIDVMDGGGVNGSAKIAGTNKDLVTNYEKKGDPNMSNYSAQLYLVGNDIANAALWLTNESYVINNNGSLQKGDDLVNSSLDPFSIMKNVAGETIMSVKGSKGSDGTWTGLKANLTSNEDVFKKDISNTDYFAYGTNIDVVVIPDLLVAAVQRMLPALTKLD